MKTFSYEAIKQEDELRNLINAKLPVMLHGKPGCGKTARVKEIDPNVEILSLPYKDPTAIMGKSIVNPITGKLEDIHPVWYDRLSEKCAKEPNKVHILFLDEITNALPAIQAMAYQLVLDRMVNDKWSLPDNCSIVAAGNEVEDSNAAFDMPEPLHSRFAHLFIRTTAEEWITWAIKHNIDTKIISFITWKGDKALYTPYTGKEPNVDPRKWEKASIILKATNNPYMLSSILGGAITAEFTNFCQIEMPTIEEVVSGKAKVPDKLDAKYATVGAMSCASKQQLKPVWQYVSKMEDELRAIFIRMWVGSDMDKFVIMKDLPGANDIFRDLVTIPNKQEREI